MVWDMPRLDLRFRGLEVAIKVLSLLRTQFPVGARYHIATLTNIKPFASDHSNSYPHVKQDNLPLSIPAIQLQPTTSLRPYRPTSNSATNDINHNSSKATESARQQYEVHVKTFADCWDTEERGRSHVSCLHCSCFFINILQRREQIFCPCFQRFVINFRSDLFISLYLRVFQYRSDQLEDRSKQVN
jgi:hypothetical protein